MEAFNHINQFLKSSSQFYTIAIGLDSTYSYVSPNYDRNFSFDKGTLKGRHFSITLHPDDVRICEETGPKCFEHPGTLYPVTLRKHDGRGGFVTTQWEMRAMLDDDGVPQGIFCIGYNISEFVNTMEKLDEASTRLDEISFIQSHGVRKPLANIMGISRLFELAESADEYPDLIKMLNESATELEKIIQQISNKRPS